MSNVDIVSTAYDAFGRGDIPAIIDLVDESIDWSSPMTLPQGGHFSGPLGVTRFFEGLGASWQSLAVEREVLDEVSADTVVAIVKGHGVLRSGSPADFGATHVFTLSAGKVTRFREFTDVDKPLDA